MATARARPLRADAQRNQDRIIAAADAAFAEHGLDVSVEEIARRAGVGAATLYRRFPSKDALLLAILDARLAQLEATLAPALANPDPWQGLLAGMQAVISVQASNMALLQVLAEAGTIELLKGEVKERIFDPLCLRFVAAQRAGQVRPDLDPGELHELMHMVAVTASHHPDGTAGNDWQRYLALLADAMRTPAPSRLPPL